MLIFLGSIALVVILLLSEMPIAFAFGIGALVSVRLTLAWIAGESPAEGKE